MVCMYVCMYPHDLNGRNLNVARVALIMIDRVRATAAGVLGRWPAAKNHFAAALLPDSEGTKTRG